MAIAMPASTSCSTLHPGGIEGSERTVCYMTLIYDALS
jgi:hypothetical protein